MVIRSRTLTNRFYSVHRSLSLDRLSLCATVILVHMMVGNVARANDEGTLYIVGDNDHADACGGSDFEWHFSAGNYVYGKWGDWGFDRREYYSNRSVDDVDLTDVNEDSHGQDHVADDGADTADVVYVYTHGNYDCTQGSERSLIQGGDNRYDNECKLDYSGEYGANDVFWGDSDLDIIILDACSTLQRCVWQDLSYFDINGSSLNAILGFHGLSYDSWGHQQNLEDFVSSSRYNGIGDNWVDDMTDGRGWLVDECAIAITYGATEADRDNIYNNAGFQDRLNAVTSVNSASYYYIENCDPAAGEELP